MWQRFQASMMLQCLPSPDEVESTSIGSSCGGRSTSVGSTSPSGGSASFGLGSVLLLRSLSFFGGGRSILLHKSFYPGRGDSTSIASCAKSLPPRCRSVSNWYSVSRAPVFVVGIQEVVHDMIKSWQPDPKNVP